MRLSNQYCQFTSKTHRTSTSRFESTVQTQKSELAIPLGPSSSIFFLVLPISLYFRNACADRRFEITISLTDKLQFSPTHCQLFDKKAKIGMDEEMIFLDNIMPVEIALKREIEYRRKVEAWRKQQQIDPKIDTLQLEGPPPSLPGTKRKAPPTSSQGSCSKQAFQKQPAGLVCMVCKVSFSNFYYLKKHCESQTHKEKLLQMKKWGTPLSNPLMCELCNARCSSEVVLEGHLSGTKHATGLKELESAKLGREGEAKLQIFSEKHWN